MTSPLLPQALGRQLEERTCAARAEVDRLDEAIADLTGRLHNARKVLTRLETTSQTLTELAEQTPPEAADFPAVYQQILAVLARAPDGLRTKDIRHALGLPDQPKHTEGTRAKLERLVGRGIAKEP